MDYPEHDKVRAVKTESQAIGGFIEWLAEQGIFMCTRRRHGMIGDDLLPVGESIEVLLARYFKVDLEKFENEKRAMLEKLRAAQDGA